MLKRKTIKNSRVTFWLDHETRQVLRALAVAEDIPVSSFVRRILRNAVNPSH